jgi:polyhydroxybutyrate depolymerase
MDRARRRIAAFLSAAAVAATLGVIGSSPAPAATGCTVTGSGTTTTRTLAGRSYLLHVPSNLTGPAVPLVLDLHGLGEATSFEESWSGWSAYADTHNFIVAYPAGTGFFPSWDYGRGSADVAFLRNVVADIAATWCINPTRIHASGISNGALMSLRLACDAADLFASIHAHAGADPTIPSASQWAGSTCTPSRPISVAITEGIFDPLSSYPAGLWTRDQWLVRDGCPSTGSSEPNVYVEAITYRPCAAGVEVLWRVYPQSHNWPTNQPFAADADDIHNRVWGLFQRNPRP